MSQSNNPCKTRAVFARACVRGAVLLAAAACAWPHGEPAWLAGLVPALSPFVALLAVAARAGGLFLAGAAAVALLSLFFPRLFCRWLCPVGTCQDALPGRLKQQVPALGRLPQLGVWLVLLGLGAALAGWPLFGWLDPLALFSAAFGLARPHLVARDWLAAAGLPLLLALGLVAPGLWCGKLCPLGALQDLLRAPLRLLAARTTPKERRGKPALSRRAFLGLGAGAGYRLALPPGPAAHADVIRPPLSGPAGRFTRLCVRCGACVRACPNGILKFGGAGSGWAGVLAPEVSFDRDYCSPSCTSCGQACPSGAIPRFSAQDKFTAPMGVAVVDHDRCLLGHGRECGACVNACPHGALDLAWDPVDLVSSVVVDAKACTGCGCCDYVCLSEPHAIRVRALKRLASR